jgi:Fe-S cluster assembly ATPase SufC
LRTSIDLDPNLSVLIGPNGSGKTNILKAIMYLNKMAQEEHYPPFHTQVGRAGPRIKATFEQANGAVRLSALVGTYTDEFNNDVLRGSLQNWQIGDKKRKRTLRGVPLAFARRLSQSQRLRLHYFQRSYITHLSKPSAVPRTTQDRDWRALAEVAKYCLGITYYGASQFTNPGSCPVSFEIEEENERQAVLRLRGHAKFLHNMYSASKAEANAPYAQFIDIVGPKGLRLIDSLKFREFQVSSVDRSVRVGGKIEVRTRHKRLVIPQFRIGKQKLSPNQLSEGTFKTLALLFHVVTGSSTALLIEEPEVCVHHGLLSSILEVIKSASRRKQIILSTHSDYVLDQVKPENVYVVSSDRAVGTQVYKISKTMNSSELGGLREYLATEGNLGEYWREGGLEDRS